MVHFANVFISSLVASEAVQNPCVLYFLNIVVDTTVGMSCHLAVRTQRPHDRIQVLGYSIYYSGDLQKS